MINDEIKGRVEMLLSPAINVHAPYARQMVRALCELIEAERWQPTGWHPITKAPKDGTKVLGWDGAEIAVVQYVPAGTHHSDQLGYWELAVCGTDAADGDWEPTHWMHVPGAPIAQVVHPPHNT